LATALVAGNAHASALNRCGHLLDGVRESHAADAAFKQAFAWPLIAALVLRLLVGVMTRRGGRVAKTPARASRTTSTMQQAANLTHGARALVQILAGVCAEITTGPAKRHASGALLYRPCDRYWARKRGLGCNRVPHPSNNG